MNDLWKSPGCGRTVALSALAIVAWCWAFLQEMGRISFLDDAFIYLALARNVVEAHTAQLFPIAGNEGLVASSPLRLLLLVPSYLVGTWVHDAAPSREVASLTFFVSGLLTSLLFLPFFRTRRDEWLAVATVAGLLASTTNSMLQMEGAMIFWSVYCLVRGFAGAGPPRTVAWLVPLLFLVRVEFGVAALLATLLWRRRPDAPRIDVWTMIAIAGAVAAVWVMIARALGVWPVPTTFLTKVHTGALRRFGPPFLRTFAEVLAQYLWLPEARLGQRIVVGCGAAACGLLLAYRRHGRLAAVLLVGVTLILGSGPGNFVWYHENVMLATIATMLAMLAAETAPSGYRWRLLLVVLSLLGANAAVRCGRNDRLPWQLLPPPAYGGSLVWLAERHEGKGLFRVPVAGADDRASAFVSIAEIGIVSYFAGASCWLFDSSGLAQAGQLPGVRDSPLTLVYPARVLRTAIEELEIVRPPGKGAPLYEVHHLATGPGPKGGVVSREGPWTFERITPK